MSETPPTRASASRRSRAAWVALPLLAVLTLAFYRRVTLTNQIMAGVDALTYFYPYRDYAAQAVREGRVPLWDTYLFLGAPFLANPQAAVLYPLNALLAWLPAPKIVAWSAALHVALAAGLAYALARRGGRMSASAAVLAAGAFALGGFLSGQVEHVNQLNVSAWFPLLLLLWEVRGARPWGTVLALGAAIGVGLLAGHAQSSYISLAGLGVYALLGAFVEPATHGAGAPQTTVAGASYQRSPCPAPAYDAPTPHITVARRLTRTGFQATAEMHLSARLRGILARLWGVAWPLGLAALIGAALAAAQLLPTLELARLSIRGGGLSYREVVAFSLKPLPRLLWHAFLPPWGRNLADVFGGDYYTEFLAYVGALPLLLAALALWRGVRGAARARRLLPRTPAGAFAARMAVLAALGVLLALGAYDPLYYLLYKVVPGFDLFRVPARWLLLYALGAAMLAGLGLDAVRAWWARRAGGRTAAIAAGVLAAIGLAELLAAGEALPLNRVTAPEAYSSLRTAPAHILAAQMGSVMPGRFLSMSDIAFDPGDLAEIQQILGGQVSERAIYDYVVAVKRQEILAPNLPLAWRIYAADGYDGGVLPLARYILLQRLLLPEDQILEDGRLREGLTAIPSSRLLSLLGVRYVITDKVHDAWIDDVFYDLAFDAALGVGGAEEVRGELAAPYAATALGIVSYLEGAAEVANGTPVAEVRVEMADGTTQTLTLRAGQDTAEGLYGPGMAHAQARVGHAWRDRPEGSDYVARLRWDAARSAVAVEVRALPFGGQLHVRGAALIDARDGSSVPLLLSTAGRYRQVHSGDVKVYEVLDALPRAWAVSRARVLADDEAALGALADPAFDPGQEVVLAAGQALDGAAEGAGAVTVTRYAPEAIELRADMAAPGYVVLSDAWYPGWQAEVDGRTAAVERANLAFRAVYVPEGTHAVRLAYRPASWRAGVGISLAAPAGLAIAAIWAVWSRRRPDPSRTVTH